MANDFVQTGAELLQGTNPSQPVDITLVITIIVLIVVFSILAGVITYLLASRKQWKYTIVKFETVNGRLQDTAKDKAKILRLNHLGDEVLFLKKHKKILPKPTLQTGINRYWYEVTSDDEWINIEPKSIDSERKQMGMNYLDKEMRYARGSLSYMNKERYEKAGFMEKYGGLIAYSVLILITAVGFWLLIDKMIEAMTTLAKTAATNKEAMELAKQVLGIVDNMKSGGTGFVPSA